MGRVKVVCFHVQSSEDGCPACVDYGSCWLGRVEQALIMHWRIRDLWSPANLVALTIAKLDVTLPCLQDVHRDSVGHPQMLVVVSRGRHALG
jgi:hypothetical protein